MRLEEAKLEKLRRKMAEHELKIVRGQLSVNERDLHTGLDSLDRDDSEDSDVLGVMQAGVLRCTCLHRCAKHGLCTCDVTHCRGPIQETLHATCAEPPVMVDRPNARPQSSAAQGSLMAPAGNVEDAGSDDAEDFLRNDSAELERFDMDGQSASRSHGGDGLGESEGPSLDMDPGCDDDDDDDF